MTALLDLLRTRVSIGGWYLRSVEEGIIELAHGARTYYADNALANALCHLDNSCIRVAYKAVRKQAMETLRQMVVDQEERRAFIDRLRTTESIATHVIRLSGVIAEFVLWRQFAFGDLERAWQGLRALSSVETILDDLPDIPYPPGGDRDLVFFANYGHGLDMLLMGTWDTLHINANMVSASNLTEDVKTFAHLTWEEARAMIPGAPAPSSDL